MTKGGKNLLLLGIIAILVAGSTTGVSLALYHNSGDIYLDRSRPGFLPDEDEIEGNNNDSGEEYVFQKSGELTIKDTEEYLKKLDEVIKMIESYKDPFGAEALSDERLGIE